jgi:hypothetical protein
MMPKKKILTGRFTARGFALYDFQDGNGEPCSLQQSSAYREEGGLLWLGIDSPEKSIAVEPRVHPAGPNDSNLWEKLGDAYPDKEFSGGRMHLTQEQAGELAKHLAHFAKTGQLRMPRRPKEATA